MSSTKSAAITVITKCENLIEAFRKLRKIIFDNFSQRDKNIWLRRIQHHIILCNKLIRKGKITVHNQRRLQTVLQKIKTVKQLIQIKCHSGSGISGKANKPSNRVKWENIKSCYKGGFKPGLL